MRVKVSEIDNGHAYTPQAGMRLRELIDPALGRGEEVVLDFEGVKHFSAAFFCASIGALVEADEARRLPALLHYENLLPLGQSTLESAIDFATRRRESPAGAAAWDAAYKKLFGGDWD